MKYEVTAQLEVKCIRIREHHKLNPNHLRLFICDFDNGNGNKVSNVHISVPDDKPMPFEVGDLCRIICDFRQMDVIYAGKPLDDKSINEAAGIEE